MKLPERIQRLLPSSHAEAKYQKIAVRIGLTLLATSGLSSCVTNSTTKMGTGQLISENRTIDSAQSKLTYELQANLANKKVICEVKRSGKKAVRIDQDYEVTKNTYENSVSPLTVPLVPVVGAVAAPLVFLGGGEQDDVWQAGSSVAAGPKSKVASEVVSGEVSKKSSVVYEDVVNEPVEGAQVYASIEGLPDLRGVTAANGVATIDLEGALDYLIADVPIRIFVGIQDSGRKLEEKYFDVNTRSLGVTWNSPRKTQ